MNFRIMRIITLITIAVTSAQSANAVPFTTIEDLPKDVKGYLISFIASGNVERGITTTAAINKSFFNAINDPKIMIAVLNWIVSNSRYTAHAVDLAERLQKKTATLPVMQNPEISAWITTMKSNLESGEELFAAVSANNSEIVQDFLKNKDIDLNWRNDLGTTPLIEAVLHNKPELVKILIAAGANLNAQDNEGYTALLWAEDRDSKKIMELLLAAGANTEIADKSGKTVRIYASKKRKRDIIELLDKALAKRKVQ